MLPTHHAAASPSATRPPTTLAHVLLRRARAAALKRARKHLRKHAWVYRVALVICCSVLVTAALFTSLVVAGEPGSSPKARRVPPQTTGVAEDYVVKPPPGAIPPPLLQPPTVLEAYRAGEAQSEEVSNSGGASGV
jgi:hypothetical protein